MRAVPFFGAGGFAAGYAPELGIIGGMPKAGFLQ